MTSSVWRSERLKNVAEVAFSSVDKKSVDGEMPVRLCNYTDVYYNDEITADLPFMEATASRDQVRMFGLKAGEVLITKDSETADDIGVAALVPETMDDVVCGYHLAVLRPKPERIDPKYLFWSLCGGGMRQQMTVSASGVTRFGLRFGDVGNLELFVPDLATQRGVARSLDRETARINAITSRRERHLRLLSERRVEWRRAAFSTGGPGGRRLLWLPPIPDDWQVLPLRWVTKCLDGRRVPLNAEQRSGMPGDIPYWGANGIVDRVDDHLFDEDLVLLGEDGAPFFDHERDVAFFVTERVWVNNHIHVLRPIGIRGLYLSHYLNLIDYGAFITGTTRDKLTQEEMGRIPVPVPHAEEQVRIEQRIEREVARVDELMSKIQMQIQMLREHRQALITAAVTGEIDESDEVA